MPTIKIKKGLDLPISGALRSEEVSTGPPIEHVALLPQEAVGIKTRLLVQVGDAVQLGTPLFVDKRNEQAAFTSPAAGEVVAIHRGKRRAVLAVVVKVSGFEDQVPFTAADPEGLTAEQLSELMCRSGLWNSLRQRPYDKVPEVGSEARALFICAADSNPLAASPLSLLKGRADGFRAGLTALSKLAPGKTWLCTHGQGDWTGLTPDGVQEQRFEGAHPAGNVGVHIHHLDPVGAGRVAWHIGFQDVADLGELLLSGKLPTVRRIALSGPAAKDPRVVETVRGAAMADLGANQAACDKPRFISGSVLAGATAEPGKETGFLGRYHNQIVVLDDAPQRAFLGWLNPFVKAHTVTNTALAKFTRKKFDYTTDVQGSLRAIVPIGSYEKVMPMEVMPTQLFRALCSNDLGLSEKLGVLELAEEDIALCEYVCPSKIAFGSLLRAMLTRIEKEG